MGDSPGALAAANRMSTFKILGVTALGESD